MVKELTEMRFKDCSPEQTIENVKKCLSSVGILLEEKLIDPGIGNCYSVHVFVKDGYPMFTNGKGVTPELARASAYGEFIERLQCGLFFYKFQSISRDRELALQYYAPDGKYMTMQQLEEDGKWMDYLIKAYGNGLTRQKIAQQCQMYACTQEDKIWTVPYYSLFEDKYVYMPADFVEHIYTSNGCCAGNTREEAWVHALSESIERNSTIRLLSSGKAAPRIPDELLMQYEVPRHILEKIRNYKDLDVTILDFSDRSGFPVIGVRLINKKTQGYIVNTAADPIFEIALSRGLTEIFQGQVLEKIDSVHGGTILVNGQMMPLTHNILNQLETGNGLFSLPFFTEEISCEQGPSIFDDNSGMNNKELLEYMLDRFKKAGRQVYVRNCSFLGFPSYYFVIPGYSEIRGYRMIEKNQEYAMGDSACAALRDPVGADSFDLAMLPVFYSKIQTAFSRRDNFAGLAGIPLNRSCSVPLLYTSLAYASYRKGNYKDAERFLSVVLKPLVMEVFGLIEEEKSELACFSYYLHLKAQGIDGDKLRLVMDKFFQPEVVKRLYGTLVGGATPLDRYLLKCDTRNCTECRYKAYCSYEKLRTYFLATGQAYSRFTDGQSREHLRID